MIIREIRQNLTVVLPHTPTPTTGSVTPVELITPGGQFTWKVVRISNQSPYLCKVENTTDQWNNPVQHLAPYQQNIYQFYGRRGNIMLSYLFLPFKTPPTSPFVLVEYGDDWAVFPGKYPNPLSGKVAVIQ